MDVSGERPQGLLTPLLEYARALLGVDQALFVRWDEAAGTMRIVAAAGTLTAPEVSETGLEVPFSAYYEGGEHDTPDRVPVMEPLLMRRDDAVITPLMAQYMDRAGIAQELYVHLPVPGQGRWVLECLYVDGSREVGDEERRRVLELARLGLAVIESEEMSGALREEEAHQRLLMEALPVLTYQIDEEDRTTVRNPGPLVAKLGAEQEPWREDPFNSWVSHLHDNDRPRVLQEWAACRAAGIRFDSEYRMVDGQGRVTWVRDTAVPVDDRGAILWHGLIVDITDPVELAQRLQVSEVRYRSLVEQIPALVYVQHDRLHSTVLNMGGFHDLLGYTLEEWEEVHQLWSEMLHPADRDRVLAEWDACYGERRPFSEEYRLVGRDGQVVWVRDSTSPVADASSDDWHGVMFDVTDLVATAERLRETELRYRNLVEQIPVVTYLDGSDGQGIYVSPQVEEMMGVPVEQWVGRYDAWMEAVHPDDRPATDAAFRRMLAGGGEFDLEYRVVLPDGRVRWMHDRARPIPRHDGQPNFIQGVIVDITDRRLVAEATERQAQRQRAIAELGLRALEGTASGALCRQAAEMALTTLGGVGAAVLRSDGDGLVIVGGAGLLDVEPGSHRVSADGTSPAGWTLVLDTPLVSVDFLAETRFEVTDQARDAGLRSCACVKVAGHGRPFGVLGVYGDRPGVFGQDALDFLQALANVLAAAVDRERVQAALETSEEQRRRVLGELLRSADAERARIATELHDDTIQVMTAALIGLDQQVSSTRRGDADAADRAVRLAREMLSEAVDRTRRLTFELRPPLLQARGLETAVRDLVDETGRAAGFDVAFDAAVSRHPAEVESLCYRTVQELVANARKHAAASRLEVRLWDDNGSLAAEVADDGVGFDIERAFDRSLTRLHLGLDSAAERIRLAGGELSIDSSPGSGTRISFTIPT